MFEFKKLCSEYEKLNSVERGILLAEKSVSVVKGLKENNLTENPLKMLVTFIIGSVVSDGALSEKDYLYIYPSLLKAFGNCIDFHTIKQTLQLSKDVKKEIEHATEELVHVISSVDENLANDIISLCLLVTSVDGKISLKEKRYIKRLCK